MNERIRQLAEQAEVKWQHQEDVIYSTMTLEQFEKFAELIIGHATECVRDVLRDENSDLSYVAATQVQNRIKEHFGVEE
jgi:adenosyl cobinamide kinase/adenosyl cobinamide phosphate guanylyltransferase